MKNMLKNVYHLKDINIISETSINLNEKGKIISMESALENCTNLVKFNIDSDWDTSELSTLIKLFLYVII